MTVYSSAAPGSAGVDIASQSGRDESGKLFSLFLVLPEGTAQGQTFQVLLLQAVWKRGGERQRERERV